MAVPSDIRGDYNASGTWRFTGDVVLPNDTIESANIDPATTFEHSVLEHRFPVWYAQADGADVTSETKMVHYAYKASTILAGYAIIDAAPLYSTGDKEVTVDVKKSTGGAAYATILTTTLTIDADSDEKVPLSLTIDDDELAAEDVLEVVVTASGSSGVQAQGLAVVLIVVENPA